MINNHDVKKRITVSGETADLYLSVSAVGINAADANQAEVAFDKFISTINGTAPEKHPPVPGAPTNFCTGKWSDAEKAAVLSVPEEEAWQNYHRLFPKSPRTKNAVWRRSGELRLERGKVDASTTKTSSKSTKLVVVPAEEKKPAAIEAPPAPKAKEAVPVVERKKRAGNQYGIPSALLKTDKKLYQRLWARCKSQGINYQEALAQEGTMKRGKRPAKLTTPVEKKPRKSPVKKERLPFHQTTTDSAASSGTNSPVITSGPSASAPNIPAPSPSLQSVSTDLKIDSQVRQIGGSKRMDGIGKVVKIRGDDILVRFGNGMDWMQRKNIAPVVTA
ncbi:MAG: hypothetical protein Q8R70_00295 [Methanoregula sp.]|nr:hypothetical protein [Methanoregula sp.]